MSHTQMMNALGKANAVRLARAGLKRRVLDGTTTAAAVILNPPPEAETMTIAELLSAQRQQGPQRVAAFLADLDLREGKLVGSLTDRQRRQLARALGHDAPEPPTPPRRVPAPVSKRPTSWVPPTSPRPCFPPPHATQPRSTAKAA